MAGIVTKSVADKPLQWLGVIGILGVGGYFIYTRIAKGKEKKSELTDSVQNPFSFNTFLNQKMPDNVSLLTWSQANAYAKTIYDALNTYFSDNEDIVYGAFKAIPSKVKVAQVARNFSALYKRDILEYIKNGNKTFDFGTGGVSSSTYSDILEIVKNKSKF